PAGRLTSASSLPSRLRRRLGEVRTEHRRRLRGRVQAVLGPAARLARHRVHGAGRNLLGASAFPAAAARPRLRPLARGPADELARALALAWSAAEARGPRG